MLSGKRVAILLAHEFEDVEFAYPMLRLSEEGAEITVGTLPKEAAAHFHTRPHFPDKPLTGRFGSTFPPVVFAEGNRWQQESIYDLRAEDYDALVIPGGFAPDYLRIDERTLSFVSAMYEHGSVVAAICHGPQVLISVDAVEGTDIVDGRRVTSFKAVRDDLRNAGAQWVDEPAVRVENVVTGRVPDDLPEFCAEIMQALRD